MKTTPGIVRTVVLVGIALCWSIAAVAQTRLLVRVDTGSDDLRGGSRAFITLLLSDGGTLPEQELSAGLGAGSSRQFRITFPETVAEARIRGVQIRYDGSPRATHPFDAYDQWDLKRLRVRLADSSFRGISRLYDSERDCVRAVRFTSESRQRTYIARIAGSEPDFVIDRVARVPRGAQLIVRNIGAGPGRLVRVTIAGTGHALTTDVDIRVPVNAVVAATVRFSGRGSVDCCVSGVDAEGRPEALTGNNGFRGRL